MAILSAVVVPGKALKGGRHKVRIAVAHNGETRYIVTDIQIDSLKEFKNGMVVKRPDAAIINTKIRGLLQRYQEVIDKMGYASHLTCPELVFQLKDSNRIDCHTLSSVFEEFMDTSYIKESSKKFYHYAWNVISKYLDTNILLTNINRATILRIDKDLRKRGLKQSSLGAYMSFLRILLNHATKCGYVQYRISPFVGYKMPEPIIRDSWLTVDEIRKIRDLRIENKEVSKCRDLFMLSYYLGGINMIDLLAVNFNECNGTLRYIRTKTENRAKANKYVEFHIPEEAMEIIERHMGQDGFLSCSDFQRRDKFARSFIKNLPIIAEQAEIKRFIYYSARKSFSQHAYDLGVSESVIDYILGHKVNKGGTSLFSYISVTSEKATKAIRLVLDNLK